MKKMVLKVQMHCQKCRTKALKIAAATHGVNEVAIQGAEKDELVVIGEEVDSVKLTCSLRKKLHNATILSIEEKKDEKKAEQNPSYFVHYPQHFIPEVLVQDPYQTTLCLIM
ncbi:heavy metal-associated isoprenylated plant protein 47-like [Durio zibethinus]|uniref:Heavy metal-associated isoprenylated plant protein 47-like n=1 Tax=Durio zibethinus TaxID=66656 RepID=A0A6P5Y4Z3_DURZI|nr:heavy metal-associated isoprenylated plant protein 47-like [Durio zibethinus]